MRLAVLVGMVGLAVLCPLRAGAQATPYVPTLDPAYADLDALVAAGWVRGAILGERPYSRLTMARFAAGARGRLAGDSVATRPRLVEALERLESEYGPEIAALCAQDRDCPGVPHGVALRSIAGDATLADSPTRSIPSSYDFPNSSYIDADLNPLLQRNQGRVLADGGTVGMEGVVDAVLSRHLAAQAHPRVTTMHDRASGGASDANLVDGYARALFGNFAVDAGRLHVALGHGHEAGPVLSHNARGLDLVRFSMDRPARLPGLLSRLGRLTVSALVADMGADVDTPHSKLIVFDGVLQPHPLVELTATVLNQQGGRGGPPATWKERLEDIFLISPQLSPISDKVVGAGIALTVPFARTRLYTDAMTTDDHNLFRGELGQAIWTEAVWIWGARTTGFGPGGRFDVWGEARHAGVRPHTHHQFTSGLTQDRRVIGDALGPLGVSFAGGAEWRGRTHRASFQLDRERYSNADLYQILPGTRFVWTRTRDLPDEERTRVTGEWGADPRPGRVGAALRLGVEHVGTYNFNVTTARWNVMAQLRLELRPR